MRIGQEFGSFTALLGQKLEPFRNGCQAYRSTVTDTEIALTTTRKQHEPPRRFLGTHIAAEFLGMGSYLIYRLGDRLSPQQILDQNRSLLETRMDRYPVILASCFPKISG